MASERWQRIEELFHATLQLEAAERSGYLLRECVDDEILRKEVESLISASESNPEFIDTPALSLGMRVFSDGLTESLVGQLIGHYKIIQLLGTGGMGEVYLAEDCKLERPVALKFIGNGIFDSQWAKDQLINEARVIARLENPNICSVYGIEEVAGHNFIVMQYVEGETLATVLSRGPLAPERVLDFSEQIVSALAAAHLRGIIHRDVKPQNIIVTVEGQIKVLDFGLAKFVHQNQAAELPNIGQHQTSHIGFVVGTVAYMSPEQTQGESLDGRSDIFSFGIVLYQMLTGKNPFLHETKEATISAINADEPSLPPQKQLDGLSKLAQKCLEKKSERRFETSEHLLLAIRGLRPERENTISTLKYFQALTRHRYFRLYAVATLAVLLVLCAAASFIYVKAARVHTIAVLPIKNQSSDPSNDYLSDGLTRNLFDKFSYLPRLKVKMPTAVPSSQTDEIVRVGRELGVEAVLFGEVLKQGESLQLRLLLLNTSDGRPAWEQSFKLDNPNFFTLQDEITDRVTSSLGMWLIGDDKKLLTKRQTDNEQALRSYMRGRVHLDWKRDRENIQLAVKDFQEAVDLDPAFAKAYTGLADSYAIMSTVTYGSLATKEAMDKAHWAARQALEIEESPEGHTSMGILKLRYDWEWGAAEEEFKRAIALNPDYPTSHYWYANLLAILGRFDEAIRQSQIARDLDPYSPLAAMNYCRALYYAKRYDSAYKHLDSLLKERPDYAQFLNLKGLVELQRGDISAAIFTLEKLRSVNFLMAAAPLGYAYGKAGRYDEALQILRKLEELSKEQHVPAQEKAIIHIGIGDIDGAFVLLEESYQERFASLAYLNTEPLFDDLRDDPRFRDLARRVGLSS